MLRLILTRRIVFSTSKKFLIFSTTKNFCGCCNFLKPALVFAKSQSSLCSKPAWPTAPSSTSGFSLTENDFVVIAKKCLDQIACQLEDVAEKDDFAIPSDFDVSFNGDVLTLRLGGSRGTFVLNTQTPNRQIWLSSPFSGPKRYDWLPSGDGNGQWVYKHDNSELGELLSRELSRTFNADITIDPYLDTS